MMLGYGKQFYACFLDKKWFYVRLRQQKTKFLPSPPGEDPKEVTPYIPTTIIRQHAIKVWCFFIRLSACQLSYSPPIDWCVSRSCIFVSSQCQFLSTSLTERSSFSTSQDQWNTRKLPTTNNSPMMELWVLISGTEISWTYLSITWHLVIFGISSPIPISWTMPLLK